VPAETVYSQIDAVGRQYAKQAWRLFEGAGSRQLGVGGQRSEVDAAEVADYRGARCNVGLLV
jgi:hypothetical protein